MIGVLVQIKQSNHIEVSGDLVKLFFIVVVIFVSYFFSVQLQRVLSSLLNKFSSRVGVYSVTKEYALQRYVYQHSTGNIAKLYNWVNNQLVSLGLKKLGVTVVGYLLFWAFISFLTAVLLSVLVFGFGLFIFLFLMLYVVFLVITRVAVSERMEMREADIMNAIDLIIPEVGGGVKNAIATYRDNFAPSIRNDFEVFVTNIQDRGYSFEDAMYMLSDSLGLIFHDFAQKAIYFEAVGEREMLEIFADITEQNRLRRELRDKNNVAFLSLRTNFLISVVMVVGYFCFLMLTDDFSRYFFLQTSAGMFLLLLMLGVVFGVLAYITTIKSKVI